MLSKQTVVGTARASRYLVQLCEHLDQLTQRPGVHGPAGRHSGGLPGLRSVEWTPQRGVVMFDRATFIVTAGPDALTLRVEAEDAEHLERIEHALSARIETIGRRDGLSVSW